MGEEDLGRCNASNGRNIWSYVLAGFIELYGFFNVRHRINTCKSCEMGPNVYR